MLLETNFSEIPDRMPVIEPGIYDCTVTKVSYTDGLLVPQTGSKMASHSFQLQIQDGPQKSKVVFEEFPVGFLPPHQKDSRDAIRFKHFLMSAGIDLSKPFDTNDLQGKSVRVKVGNTNYKANDGSTQVKAVVQGYEYKKA